MRTTITLLLLTAFCNIDVTRGNRICKRAILTCNVTNADTGATDLVDYNTCTQICCGGILTDRDVNLECCGAQDVGGIYNTDTELCCAWVAPGETAFGIFNKTGQGEFCCGTELFTQDMYRDRSCCTGYLTRSAPFFQRTEMCCNGNVQFAGDTAYTSCCGDLTYDRRFNSCPCHNGGIGLNISESDAGCCYGEGNLVRSPYNKKTQACCNGQAYDKDSQFCCGNIVGDSATELCCSDAIIAREPGQTGANLACCILLDGTSFTYNNDLQICCAGEVQDRTGDATDQICCGDVIYLTADSGDSCCGILPFDSSTSVCCNGAIQTGNACCNGEGFSSEGQVCCGGELTVTTFKYPSCCVNQTYDSNEQTCCGVTVFDNPLLPTGIEGEFTTSRTTRCCGDFSDSATLLPYDYLTSECCNGNVASYGNIDRSSAECCSDSLIDINLFLCCDGIAAERSFGVDSVCCGEVAINSTSTICCGGIPSSRNENTVCCGNTGIDSSTSICCNDVSLDLGGVLPDNAACCGNAVTDSSLVKCCNNVPRSLNGIAPDKAICCGEGCIDGTTFFCCEGKQYSKGDTEGIDVTGLTCGELIPGAG